MPKTIGFHHGALAGLYEEQANEQGYTLGDAAEFAQRLGDGLVEAWSYECITDDEYYRILQRFHKKILIKNLKKLERD